MRIKREKPLNQCFNVDAAEIGLFNLIFSAFVGACYI